MAYLNVLNRSEKSDVTARIENVTGKPGAELDVWEMNHPDLKATHTFGADRKVRPAIRKVSAQVSGNAFSYKFPKHSLTILRFRVGA